MLKQINGIWKLMSVSKPGKVLKIFGKTKPSEEEVQKEEKRIQYFKNMKECKMKSFTEFQQEQLDERMSVQSSNDFDSIDHWRVHKDFVIWANKQPELNMWQGDIGDAIFNYKKQLKEIPAKIEYLEQLQTRWEMADEKVELMGK